MWNRIQDRRIIWISDGNRDEEEELKILVWFDSWYHVSLGLSEIDQNASYARRDAAVGKSGQTLFGLINLSRQTMSSWFDSTFIIDILVDIIYRPFAPHLLGTIPFKARIISCKPRTASFHFLSIIFFSSFLSHFFAIQLFPSNFFFISSNI